MRGWGRAAAVAVAAVIAFATAGCADLERRIVEGAVEEATEATFYASPSPSPPGAPGLLERVERLESAPDGVDGWRIMYHSTDAFGEPLLTTAIVAAPSGGGTEERPVLAWAHPTTGTAPSCAPSVGADPFDPIIGLGQFIDAGYVVVAADYPNMGMAGPPSYLIAGTEAHSVLDSVRAAAQLPEARAGTETAIWGHSQGGHAALFAALEAPDYAPELDVRGVAVAAPAADLTTLLDQDIDDLSGVTIGAYAFQAYADAYGSTVEGLDLSTILSPAAVTALPEMNALCLLGHTDELHAIAEPLVGSFTTASPTSTEPWAGLLAENSFTDQRLGVPVYVSQGRDDTLIHPEDTARLVGALCAGGAAVASESLPGGHGTAALDSLPTVVPWVTSVLGGDPPAGNCGA